MSKRDTYYLPLNMTRQRNDYTRYERVFRLKITVASTRPIARSGDLQCDGEYGIRRFRGRSRLVRILQYVFCFNVFFKRTYFPQQLRYIQFNNDV